MRTIADLWHSYATEEFSGMATNLQSSIIVQSSYVLKEIFNGTIVSEKWYFSASIPSGWHSKPTLRDISWAYSLHVFIWPTSDSEFLQVSYFKFRFNPREDLFNYCSYFNHQQCCPTLQIYLLLTLNEWNLTGICCQNLEVRIWPMQGQ